MNAALKYDIIDNRNAQNQPQPSWNDDPFNLGDVFKGVSRLSHQRNLEDYALELVSRYASYENHQFEIYLTDLLPSFQMELARLYIESIDREIEWACYGDDQTINSNFLCSLLSMLKGNTSESRDCFARETIKNILAYYKDALQKVLDEACHCYYYAMEESHYHLSHDMYEEE